MRLYRGLKNSYHPGLVDLIRLSGTDFTDCPAVALRYAGGPRGVLLVVDVDADEHAAPARLTQEFCLDRDAKRFMVWGASIASSPRSSPPRSSARGSVARVSAMRETP